MLSTLMNYRLYSADMAKSLTRVSTQATVQRDTEYYKANIGKVKTADDLLKDQRLYAYAMKAYGLEDQIPSRGLMRKVLESDLSNANSFANKLTDKRYRDFASSFQFGSAGKAAIQTTAQTEALTEAYSEYRIRAAGKVGEVVDAYNRKIETVTSVADLLSDATLLRVVAKVAGLDPDASDQTQLKATLEDALKTGATSSSNAKLRAIGSFFQFQADGSLPGGGPPATKAQTASDLADMSALYFDEMGAGASPQAAAYRTNYVRGILAGTPTAETLAGDDHVFQYVVTAFGLDPKAETPAFIENILSSNPADPSSPLSQLPESTPAEVLRKSRLTALQAAFNYDGHGNLSGGLFSSGWSADRLQASYFDNYRTADIQIDSTRTDVLESRLSNMKTINDLLVRDARFGMGAFDYILKAFDLDPATESPSKIRQVLLSDPSDPKSFVSRLNDERYERLAAAFNFGPDGKVSTQRLVQSTSAQAATGSLYASSFGADVGEARKSLIRDETRAYLTSVGQIRSLDDFIADKSVTKYALKAYGLADENISDRDLRRLLTSDLADPTSFANAKDDKRYVKFVQAFNFTTDGRIQREGEGAQTGAKLLTTQNQYLLQTMEKQVGEQSEGARLALYFLRKAPDVTTAYGILADKALFEVVRTALGLPASIAGMDIEKQAKLLESRMDFKDFQDVKKLDKFISRFSSLYDTANGGGSTSPILALFGNSAGANGLLGFV